ncbi:hypothetical protein HNQ07_004083 [Deinococcus metalli]|uniref:HNH endonuclease n=1 Tax=Deinococcus metalli TaxID=1141878 RepID=A0A7W8NR53_9DEIO|nr:hypothetical protein [Deinococcus metalli]MBB5378576.1 hypothetical protein [Deinococcus metalli]GHF58740.1 hypothetical protein GCM10017781_38790 [Deinococcus metalli]
MIALTHDRRAAVIPSTFRGSNQKRRELTLLKAQREGTTALKSSQWKGAKAQLRAETQRKCAYCDAPAAAVAHCDVEHYRPKSIYWWLALCYDNYLYACQICNQVHKGDRFPIAGPPLTGPVVHGVSDQALQALVGTFAPDPLDLPALPAHLAAWAAERPLAVNPYLVDPEPLFAYEADVALQEVSIVPEPTQTAAEQEVARQSIGLYGLNREELRLQRYITFEILSLAHEGLVEQPNNARMRAILERQVAPEHEFSGMCRYFVRRVWDHDV